jgi:hypothetical protein
MFFQKVDEDEKTNDPVADRDIRPDLGLRQVGKRGSRR